MAQNLGQSIWISPEITVFDESKTLEIATEDFSNLEPRDLKLIYFTSRVFGAAGKFDIPLVLKYKDKTISESRSLEMIVVRPAEVKSLGLFAKIQVWFRDFLDM